MCPVRVGHSRIAALLNFGALRKTVPAPWVLVTSLPTTCVACSTDAHLRSVCLAGADMRDGRMVHLKPAVYSLALALALLTAPHNPRLVVQRAAVEAAGVERQP